MNNDPQHAPARRAAVFIFIGFLAWIFAFRGFLSSHLSLTSDAISYFDHTKFFIENFWHGVYPLWDPFWYNGAPNDFFLRRIGAFNPFYLTILALMSAGIPYVLAYLWFLALYFWGGAMAFYFLSMRIYQDRLIAYAGYLLFLFSALATRLFDSYMMLVTVPMVWFFYFLVAFSQTGRKHFFLGMVLALMILCGTYIPFYFLIIVFFFSLFFILIYPEQLKRILTVYGTFIKDNKVMVLAAVFFVLFSLVPLVTFFHNSTHGEVVLPLRHGAGAGENLSVPHQTLDWGMVEDLMYSYYFSDLRLFKFAVVYVPFFSVIVFILGLGGRTNRRAVLMWLCGLGIFCSFLPHGLELYDFLYNHVFFFKYFRNLHFFIWFFLMPLFMMLCLEHWNMFKQAKAVHRPVLLLYVCLMHAFVLLFVLWRHDAIISTYITIALSLVFFTLMALNRLKPDAGGYAILTMIILAQPLQAYDYFSLKGEPHRSLEYSYHFPLRVLPLHPPDLSLYASGSKGDLYYASGYFNPVYQQVSNPALMKYLSHKLLLYDTVLAVNEEQLPVVLDRLFLTGANAALVPNGKALKPDSTDPHPPEKAVYVDAHTAGFKVLSFDSNDLKINLNLPYAKFLVYNDSFDPHWKVFINGIRQPLYRANGAFKGVWTKPGDNVIEFRYGSFGQYAINILLSVIALMLLAGTIWYASIP